MNGLFEVDDRNFHLSFVKFDIFDRSLFIYQMIPFPFF